MFKSSAKTSHIKPLYQAEEYPNWSRAVWALVFEKGLGGLIGGSRPVADKVKVPEILVTVEGAGKAPEAVRAEAEEREPRSGYTEKDVDLFYEDDRTTKGIIINHLHPSIADHLLSAKKGSKASAVELWDEIERKYGARSDEDLNWRFTQFIQDRYDGTQSVGFFLFVNGIGNSVNWSGWGM